MVPTLKELKILLDATVIVLMPCLKKIKHIGRLVQNALATGFYIGLFEEGDGKKCFSDSCTMLLHQMCEESMPGCT